jgi:hypothetical protein
MEYLMNSGMACEIAEAFCEWFADENHAMPTAPEDGTEAQCALVRNLIARYNLHEELVAACGDMADYLVEHAEICSTPDDCHIVAMLNRARAVLAKCEKGE